LALSALADATEGRDACAEATWLRSQSHEVGGGQFAQWLLAPAADDELLSAVSRELDLSHAETLAIAVAAAVEFDPMVGRVLAWLQTPVGGARPTLGLLQTIAELFDEEDALRCIVDGRARACGLLKLETDTRPLPEQPVQVPVPLVLGLRGQSGCWPEVRIQAADARTYPGSLLEAVARQAQALQTGSGVLAVRSGHPREACAAAALVARQLGLQAAFFDKEPPRGLGPWLWLRGALPVMCAELAPGETRRVPDLPGYRGPLLLATGMDGSFEREGDPVGSWRVPLPPAPERAALWSAHLEPQAAGRIGKTHRYGLAHIDLLCRAAHHQAKLAGDDVLTEQHVTLAARGGAAGELGTLAQLMPDHVPDDALVVPLELRQTLLALLQRCRMREGLADALGPSTRTRYRPGVRALLVGPSGTGKTLAVGWIATHLGLPLYRVDLASVASKYIGETEKNLAQLFARAEHVEAVLLFDEADSLFGKRTDIKDANDRFANQQTNYLLQRIETFDGIALLTSNSRSRFDAAFTRRLDSIIDFPLPSPEERRALWMSHLGSHHCLSAADLNRIAVCCDLSGGHIRNAVLTAAVLAQARDEPIGLGDLVTAVTDEYRKLGRQVPSDLRCRG
jgi:hypothetical protein